MIALLVIRMLTVLLLYVHILEKITYGYLVTLYRSWVMTWLDSIRQSLKGQGPSRPWRSHPRRCWNVEVHPLVVRLLYDELHLPCQYGSVYWWRNRGRPDEAHWQWRHRKWKAGTNVNTTRRVENQLLTSSVLHRAWSLVNTPIYRAANLQLEQQR